MADSEHTLLGRTALITGGAKRLGRATALALAAEGADVVVHYRESEADARNTAAEIEKAGRRAWTLQADLADTAQAEILIPQAIKMAGPIDILINNASIFPVDRVVDFSPNDLAMNVQIHAMSPLQLGRAFAAQNRSGDMINFLDSRITDYDREHAAYHLSKRMLYTLTRLLAVEFAPKIKVNAVAPGLILPPPGQDEAYLEQLKTSNPLQRYGRAQDIAEAAVFLLRSDFITGQVIFVDGGRHLRGRMYD
ncbi:MAG: SDR family oxidoreductase [Phycisphaerales bacterium]|nr:SDR family oxidoreductase [Phycisphaerales bacterium]